MDVQVLSKADALPLLFRRLREGLENDFEGLRLLREDPTEPETMGYPLTLAVVVRDAGRADDVTDIVTDVNLETDSAFPAFTYVIPETEYNAGKSLKTQVMKEGIPL